MYHIELAFGHRCRDGSELSSSRIAVAERMVLEAFAQLFRGGRMRRELGSYQTSDGRMMLERCTIASCETGELGDRRRKLVVVACNIAEALEQETVLLTITQINGEQQWLKPTAA